MLANNYTSFSNYLPFIVLLETHVQSISGNTNNTSNSQEET